MSLASSHLYVFYAVIGRRMSWSNTLKWRWELNLLTLWISSLVIICIFPLDICTESIVPFISLQVQVNVETNNQTLRLYTVKEWELRGDAGSRKKAGEKGIGWQSEREN